MSTAMKEAEIIINGHVLTLGEAMAVRVAVESFVMELRGEGLGEDETGKELTRLYLQSLDRVLARVHRR